MEEIKLLEEQLTKISKRIFSLPNLVWDSEYHVDEEATSKVCSEYTRLVEEYERLAIKLNNIKHKGEKIMIRKEVEKLRGTVFTPEELEEVIIPMLSASNLKEEKNKFEPTDNYSSFVAEMADKIEQRKHQINDCFFHKKPYYMYLSRTVCYGKEKDALFIAKQSFKLAGYDPDKYNFDAGAREYYPDMEITITVKD